jgi:FAD/FMN-containing dehydrogenase
LANLIEIIDKAPCGGDSSIRVYSLGGAIRDIEPCATAFAYRQANYIMAIASSWECEDEAPDHKEWVRAGFKYIYTITRGSYVNFPYTHMPNYQRAYYDDHLLRLQRIKKEYDPDNIFDFPQSIKL